MGSRGWELWEVWEEPACPVNKSVFSWQVPGCAGLLCKIKEPVSSSSVLRLGLSLPALTYSIYTWLVGTWLLLWKPHLSLSLFLSFSSPPPRISNKDKPPKAQFRIIGGFCSFSLDVASRPSPHPKRTNPACGIYIFTPHLQGT